MKVRWTNSSVRLRITPAELAQIQNEEMVWENFTLPGVGGWSVRVVPSDSTSLAFDNEVLFFSLAKRDIETLSHWESEGVYFSQEGVRFFIEKDFPCAHPRSAQAAEIPTETFMAPPDFEARKNN